MQQRSRLLYCILYILMCFLVQIGRIKCLHIQANHLTSSSSAYSRTNWLYHCQSLTFTWDDWRCHFYFVYWVVANQLLWQAVIEHMAEVQLSLHVTFIHCYQLPSQNKPSQVKRQDIVCKIESYWFLQTMSRSRLWNLVYHSCVLWQFERISSFQFVNKRLKLSKEEQHH